MSIQERPNVDPTNIIERKIGDCKVRLLFSLAPNEKIERMILDNLLLVFDRRMKAASSVQN